MTDQPTNSPDGALPGLAEALGAVLEYMARVADHLVGVGILYRVPPPPHVAPGVRGSLRKPSARHRHHHAS